MWPTRPFTSPDSLSINSGVQIPALWLNGERTDLSILDPAAGGGADSVFVADDNIYVGGWVYTTTGVQSPAYWLNGQRADLSVLDPNTGGLVYSIFVN